MDGRVSNLGEKSNLIETSLAIARIVLGMLVLIGGLIILDLIVYISATGSTASDKVQAAYEKSHNQGYDQTYRVGYQEAYAKAYEKGYDKGYEVGRWLGSKEGITTRVELRNPTYKELKEFLARDKTDSIPYVSGQYVCFDYTAELNNNAEANGIRAAYVRIRAKEWAHAVVAFQTVDRGLIFIEPQSDKDVPLVKGEPYPWQRVGATRTTNYDDAIIEIQLIW